MEPVFANGLLEILGNYPVVRCGSCLRGCLGHTRATLLSLLAGAFHLLTRPFESVTRSMDGVLGIVLDALSCVVAGACEQRTEDDESEVGMGHGTGGW